LLLLDAKQPFDRNNLALIVIIKPMADYAELYVESKGGKQYFVPASMVTYMSFFIAKRWKQIRFREFASASNSNPLLLS
jgi:hypothetical protein